MVQAFPYLFIYLLWLTRKILVTSVTGAEIIINSCVWYNYIIQLMKNGKGQIQINLRSDNKSENHDWQVTFS